MPACICEDSELSYRTLSVLGEGGEILDFIQSRHLKPCAFSQAVKGKSDEKNSINKDAGGADGFTMGAVFDVKKEVRWVTADAPRPISRFHKEICP